ncbi:MAG: ornithine cyclodeaminase family protein [Sandaracinaceae bacterium]|nr:ornithine cyclodeaminase family protein [Sandaracinaceae bacterium]
MATLLLTQSQVRSVLTMDMVVPAVERAFAAHGRGEARMPPKVYLDIPEHAGDFRAMPGALGDAAGVKWVSVYAENPSRHGLPSVMGLYILNHPDTALPAAVLDATLLTALRTGAAAAVASKMLYRDEPRSVGFIGCGVQAQAILDAHRFVFGPGFAVKAADIRRDAAERFAHENEGEAVSLEDAARCDIVCTATPTRIPVLRRKWLEGRTHINAMGADAAGKQELETAILLDAKIYVDDIEQAHHSGEVNVPISRGQLDPKAARETLGAIVAGRRAAPKNAELTVFDSTGLAIQDAAIARVAFEQARSRGIGQQIVFRS